MGSKDLMTVSYETALGSVNIDAETVKQYLVKGNGNVSDQEVFLFIKMCQAQKLNPFVTGEVYLIKFGTTPAQMVVGYDTYKRRADENPTHLYTESGIVVCRGSSGEIVQKTGACLYPTEQLVGGWCRVHKLKGEREVTTFKEVGLSEYRKDNAIWKEKPCTMIEKVAISQCLREAYPKDYEGMYTAEELAPTQYQAIIDQNGEVISKEGVERTEDEPITQAERIELFAMATNALGKENGKAVIKQLIENEGMQSTANMTKSVYKRVLLALDSYIAALGGNDAQQESK